MKKYLVMLFGIMSFIGINTVSADTYIQNHFYGEFEEHVKFYNDYKENINYLINYWEENYSKDYPYYIVFEKGYWSATTGDVSEIVLFYSKSNKISNYGEYGFTMEPHFGELGIDYDLIIYDTFLKEYNTNHKYVPLFFIQPELLPDYEKSYNYPLISNGFIYEPILETHTNILVSSYISSNLNISIPEFIISSGDIFPTIVSLYDGSYVENMHTNYIEIDLNNYAYVALSLKDYAKIPENNYSTYSNIYVKGQLCSTPVYNYGQTERKDVLTGTQVQGCTSYYNDFTLLRKYILKTDVENHAIYYLKGYDSTKENKVKIDSSIYNITYITEENKDNPQVNINGKIYPTLSYDNLTDTATKSEDDGYIPGVSCPVGDLNCYNEYNSENIFKDLFDNPLKSLQNVWTAITSIFGVITGFILLLPPTMQGFLYVAFGTTIMLGIIKILL